ncbi:hypothetical protein ARAM_007475 [Aspergillus rambellii]|uniref:Probable beta-glucosidase G n=1 Tax=Aspergillus rambellii TaxID=308745 RepID=A0A0F8TZI3_9EURO|nr:hypothetical protein ARAM_007475 [Aspergillus rambellii]
MAYWAYIAYCSVLLVPHAYSASVPTGPGIDQAEWLAARHKAEALIAKMNVTEKSIIVTGTLYGGVCSGNIAAIPRLNFGGVCIQDGPVGVRLADLASVFPAGLTVGASWDKDLIYDRGRALAEEFRAKGSHVLLGPVPGPLGRNPLGGRNWEGFGPDPYLSGVATALTVRGIQAKGVQACTKHYIGNEQETQRSNTVIDGENVEAVSINMDDRTLHELYLWPFADAVRAGTASIMCSYNRLNGTYACEHPGILNDILKNELGFDGYVMSDWFATHSGAKSINAGLDMTQPGPLNLSDSTGDYFGHNLVNYVQNGTVSSDRIDDMVRRILTPYFYLHQDEDFPTVDPSTLYIMLAANDLPMSYLPLLGGSPDTPVPAARDVRGDHAILIRKLAAAGTVLLKNVNSTLPLKAPKAIAVFGNDAADVSGGLAPFLRGGSQVQIGTLAVGGGSGAGQLSYISSPLEALKIRAEKLGTRLAYITDNYQVSNGVLTGIYPAPDVCLVFLKTWAQEGFDRLSYEADWNSSAVVEQVASYCPGKTVVVTHSGGLNTMPWATNPNVSAILAAHYPGQEAGNSIVDILYGDLEPSGRLPYTIARSEADYNTRITNITGPEAVDSSAWQSNFTEGLMIDHRHFDANNITPLYEFGYGLGYSTFEITSAPQVQPGSTLLSQFPPAVETLPPGGNPHLWDPLFNLTVTVRNSGDVEGATVVQLYISLPRDTAPDGTPVKVLRGFEKLTLKPGELKAVSLSLLRRDLSYWDTGAQGWRLPKGNHSVGVGFSSRDIRQEVSLRVL